MVRMARIYLICLFLLLILLARFYFLPSSSNYRQGQAVSFQTTLSGEPQVSARSQKFEVEGLEVVTARYPEYHYGDRLKIAGVLKPADSKISNQNGKLLKIKKTDLTLLFPKIEKLEEARGSWFLDKTFLLRRKLIANYQEFLPEPASSLLVGIVLGVKTQMSQEFKDGLRKTGLTHVVVASGMNVTLVAGFLSGGLTLFLRRQLTLPIIFFGIFFYAALAGFEAPIIRAALMGSLAFLAQVFGRQNWVVFSLILSAFLMLFISHLLIFDLGFQLSFLATAGLIFIKPVIEKAKPTRFLSKASFLGESLTTTLAAQIATLPLILSAFDIYSPFSILTNVLVLWTIPWIMAIGGIAGILGLFFYPLGQILSWAVYIFLYYFEVIVALFSRLPSWQIGKPSVFFSLSYLSFLAMFLVWFTQTRKDRSNE